MLGKGKPYLSLKDVNYIFQVIKGNDIGVSQFEREAKKIAYFMPEGYYIFKNEEKLFELYKKHLPKELDNLGIVEFGQIMEFVPDAQEIEKRITRLVDDANERMAAEEAWD